MLQCSNLERLRMSGMNEMAQEFWGRTSCGPTPHFLVRQWLPKFSLIGISCASLSPNLMSDLQVPSKYGWICGYTTVYCLMIAKIKKKTANINVKFKMWKCNFHTLPAKSHNWNSKYENSYFSCVAHWHRGDVHYNNNLRSDICCFICASLSLNICKLCFYINEQICLLPHLFVWWYKAATKSALHKGLQTEWKVAAIVLHHITTTISVQCQSKLHCV